MNYRRVLLLTELGNDVTAEVAAIRRVAPRSERLIVIARTRASHFAWFAEPASADPNEAATGAIGRLLEAIADLAPAIEVTFEPDLALEQLTQITEQEDVDLVVTGAWTIVASVSLAELRRRRRVALLWTAPEGSPGTRDPNGQIVCIALGRLARASVAAFLRDHGDPSLLVTVLAGEAVKGDGLSAALEVAGIEAEVNVVQADLSKLYEIGSGELPIGLLVVARFPPSLSIGAIPAAAVLVLPPLAAPSEAFVRAIDAPDPVDLSGAIRFRVEFAAGPGRRSPIPDQDVAVVSRGRIVAVVRTRNGQADLPAGAGTTGSFGIFRMAGDEVADPLAAIELHVTVVRPESRPLVLFDADVDDEELASLARLAGPQAPTFLAVRLRPTKSCRSLRTHLREAGIDSPVVDASLVLDEGEAFDVPEVMDAVRLARVGSRMRAAGFPVVAIVHRGPHTPLTIGFVAVTADRLETMSWSVPPPMKEPLSLDGRLDSTTGSSLIAGNSVELELDNATARRWLLEAIAQSRERVHLQVYMASDDEVGRQIERALSEAAARGVGVRVLVDSLHALHGSLGATNPLLERIGAQPGIELRVSRPVTGVPTIEELKQRDHRKLVVVDRSLALVGGRNLSHEYYTGFDEVELDEKSPWREVPWLDSGARIRGPAVNMIETSFLEAWVDAGGAAFDVTAAAPEGSTSVRVVVHRGLRDARTLEAYLALIDSASLHVYAVNGFPLILEIQHALIRAMARGVRVRTLLGHVTPTHGGQPFEGPWSSARMAATELVQSRMDALVAAGGEAYELSVRHQPPWSPALESVSPHVHAKVVSVDGRVCAVGSANLDITAGYWESELLLLVEDERVTRNLEARIDALIAVSNRVDRDDPLWQERARKREWMRYWPSVLSI